MIGEGHYSDAAKRRGSSAPRNLFRHTGGGAEINRLPARIAPGFEQVSGAELNYETPSFPIDNQRMDIELSTKSDAHDVINVTFIFTSRWIGAGWVMPLTDFIANPARTAAESGRQRFPSGATTAFKDK